MNNKAIFTIYEDKYVLMHIKDDRAEHIYVYPGLDETGVGSVINCTVDKRNDNIDSTFIRYAPGKMGFVNERISGVSCIPLMYKKEEYRGKKALFTGKISIAGQYAVITDSDRFVKASSKIPEDVKKDLIEGFTGISKDLNIGIVLRTRVYEEENGIKKAEEEIGKITEKIRSIKENSSHLAPYTVLYKPIPKIIEDLLYLIGLGMEEIVTDDKMIMEALEKEYETFSDTVNITDRVSLRFYEDSLINLCNLYSFNAKITEALSSKVYLKSGAFITFDTTEALTAVDVNSSGCSFKGAREETFLKINTEAAAEIARQIRIRNISGIIIVDFINMSSDGSYEILKNEIKELISNDRTKCKFIDFTGLGLCELTRERVGNTLYGSMKQRS